ncbi:hypothetical protein K504DRAFT_171005 [Pleomassaria siparia CBS 279.74]|uniref:Uncharacterized protein n=1 Tax=Pleomassaria siparia CBS 279.74 TaxID=1314801 RepID=A0A6G1JT86_9PLEO|nr:hypothetical protein K504DRAFT_171005 [Pleomassaria siparia CBS 279.74]
MLELLFAVFKSSAGGGGAVVARKVCGDDCCGSNYGCCAVKRKSGDETRRTWQVENSASIQVRSLEFHLLQATVKLVCVYVSAPIFPSSHFISFHFISSHLIARVLFVLRNAPGSSTSSSSPPDSQNSNSCRIPKWGKCQGPIPAGSNQTLPHTRRRGRASLGAFNPPPPPPPQVLHLIASDPRSNAFGSMPLLASSR